RKFFAAAIIEYDKALASLGHSDPMVDDKKAHALVLAGRPADALPILEESLRWSPSMAVTLDNLSEVHLRLAAASKDASDSDAHLRAALEMAQRSERINPFSPDTQVRLASLYDRLARAEDATRARERLALLQE